ncbi:MAG: serine hydrolase [Alphaproteobacteria bacterium]|nr:serine hydrolase [Alphaproteobacteria bacterium]
MRITYIALALSLVTSASAQPVDPAHLSLAAGYKAAFTCSAYFNAGRSVEQINGDELNRIYPGYRDALSSLPDAVIDEDKKTVSVRYADGFPPRISAWRPYLGCAQLPTGASADMAKDLPSARVKQTREAPTPLPEALSGDAAFAAAIDRAFDRATYGEATETTAVLVVKDGAIIAEKYREGFDRETPQRTWSVAKSIAATVIGAAVLDGIVDIDDAAGLAAWSGPSDPRGQITIANLLHMSSGLDSGPVGSRTDDVYLGGGRVVDHAITRRLIAAPGTRWTYANNDTLIAMHALRERIGNDKKYLAFPFRRVLHPLGMNHTFLETDWNGDFIMSSQVWTTARDLARLGLLYLGDGVWEGKRILPEDWADFVATPAASQPPLQSADGSQIGGYGAQFWLFGARHGLPDGTYAALGNRGQHLVIIPARNMLVIRRGFDDNGGARFDIVSFARDVLAALPE